MFSLVANETQSSLSPLIEWDRQCQSVMDAPVTTVQWLNRAEERVPRQALSAFSVHHMYRAGSIQYGAYIYGHMQKSMYLYQLEKFEAEPSWC